jgi:hypothetical protein
MTNIGQLQHDFAARVRAAKEARQAQALEQSRLLDAAVARLAPLIEVIDALGATVKRELGKPAAIVPEGPDSRTLGFCRTYAITRDDGETTELFLQVDPSSRGHILRLVLADDLDADEPSEQSFDLDDRGVEASQAAVADMIAAFFERRIDDESD